MKTSPPREIIVDIDGVKIVNKVKYLGMTTSAETKTISKEAKTSIRHNLNVLKGKIRSKNLEERRQLLQPTE